ncbi:MAG: hypothetical protein LBR98_07860 [Syntrophomonadaceae bacterium]|jgi:hypothetical protein|nr:hypothetical protein [Syntrophomonadaceae bacterium]
MSLDYQTAGEKAGTWNISPRGAAYLCEIGRVNNRRRPKKSASAQTIKSTGSEAGE